MKQLLIKILLKVGSDLLINFLKSGAEELERRKDNDFESAGKIKQHLQGVSIDGKK